MAMGEGGENQPDPGERLRLESFDSQVGISRSEMRVDGLQLLPGLAVAEQSRRSQRGTRGAEPQQFPANESGRSEDGYLCHRGAYVYLCISMQDYSFVMPRRSWLPPAAEAGRHGACSVGRVYEASFRYRRHRRDRRLGFRLNSDDHVIAGPANALRVEKAADGTPRSVSFGKSSTTASGGNLILKVLPATVDPPLPPGSTNPGRIAESVAVFDVTRGSRVLSISDAALEAGRLDVARGALAEAVEKSTPVAFGIRVQPGPRRRQRAPLALALFDQPGGGEGRKEDAERAWIENEPWLDVETYCTVSFCTHTTTCSQSCRWPPMP